MSFRSDTLSRFRAYESFLFHRNTVYLAKKQQIPIYWSLVWPDWGSKPRSATLQASTLTITPLMRCIYVTYTVKSSKSHLKPSIKKFHNIWLRNPGSSLGQVQNCGSDKPVYGFNWFNNSMTFLFQYIRFEVRCESSFCGIVDLHCLTFLFILTFETHCLDLGRVNISSLLK
jgi:hypothetical protein